MEHVMPASRFRNTIQIEKPTGDLDEFGHRPDEWELVAERKAEVKASGGSEGVSTNKAKQVE
jgi:hypothetical protein